MGKNGKIAIIELFVARVTRQGEVRMAKPCSDCIELLKSSHFHVSCVHYTNEKGEWVSEPLTNLFSTHVSMKKRLMMKQILIKKVVF